jgi:hypothetical protein
MIVQPTPRITKGGVGNLDESVEGVGLQELGSLRVDRISTAYDENYLKGMLPGETRFPQDVEAWWSITFFGQNQPVRRRFNLSKVPGRHTLGWEVFLERADIDIAKQNSRISAMNAQTSRMNSDLQRQELALKIEEATAKRDNTIREKVATAEAGANSIDNMLNTIERVKKNPALNAVLGSIEGGRFYPQRIAGMLPGTASADDRADAVALIETLGSQAFVAQIPNIKGTGALSDAEGKKLQSALQNLSREQSEKQFRENLDEAARLLTKGREGLARATGVPLGKPDTPAAPGARPPLSAFNK